MSVIMQRQHKTNNAIHIQEQHHINACLRVTIRSKEKLFLSPSFSCPCLPPTNCLVACLCHITCLGKENWERRDPAVPAASELTSAWGSWSLLQVGRRLKFWGGSSAHMDQCHSLLTRLFISSLTQSILSH